MALNKVDYPLLYIEWCDAITNENSWLTVESAISWADNEDWAIKQTGFLLKETSDYILLSMKVNNHVYTEQIDRVDGLIKIPKTWIRKRIDLSNYIT